MPRGCRNLTGVQAAPRSSSRCFGRSSPAFPADQRLFDDPYAHAFLGARLRAVLAPRPYGASPNDRRSIGARASAQPAATTSRHATQPTRPLRDAAGHGGGWRGCVGKQGPLSCRQGVHRQRIPHSCPPVLRTTSGRLASVTAHGHGPHTAALAQGARSRRHRSLDWLHERRPRQLAGYGKGGSGRIDHGRGAVSPVGA